MAASSPLSLDFGKALLERAIATFLQTYLAVYLVGDVALDVFAFAWTGPELGIALGAAGLSVVKSLLGVLAPGDGPGWTGAEQLTAAGRHAAED